MEGATLHGTPRNPDPDGALDDLELPLKSREPLEQLGICHPEDWGSITLAQPADLLQDGHTDARGGEPARVIDLSHLAHAGIAPSELVQDRGSDLGREQVQGEGRIQRHVVCSRLKRPATAGADLGSRKAE
jgi:hypothetical protein